MAQMGVLTVTRLGQCCQWPLTDGFNLDVRAANCCSSESLKKLLSQTSQAIGSTPSIADHLARYIDIAKAGI